MDAVHEDVDEAFRHRVTMPPVPSALWPVQRSKNISRPDNVVVIGPHISSSAASVRSVTSGLSRKRKYTPLSTLNNLPMEIVDQILSYLPQFSLHALLLTHSYLAEAAAIAMYDTPTFASTYRLAQFVSLVSHSSEHAAMVRCLDLSSFGQEKDHDTPLAGWREWKYRSHPLYSVQRPMNREVATALAGRGADIRRNNATHAKPNPFLRQWSLCRDVPMGAVLHLLAACHRIKKIDLSYLTLAPDYAVKSSSHPPSAFTSLIYVSDIPKSWTWRPSELEALSGTDIVEAMIKLPRLESVRIKKGLWLSTNLVTRLVRDCPRLATVNFRSSGMGPGLKWAVKSSRAEVLAAVQQQKPAV
ncbi:MAG: hypothetical protein M1832_000611 [Thelocarpon impressellum]|nr:MAG: hypothetical protein M1832_000611 [Thelocarpon impressellum]